MARHLAKLGKTLRNMLIFVKDAKRYNGTTNLEELYLRKNIPGS